MSQTPQLKLQGGWFAAGAPLLQAMEAVSDGAFKLFVYLCLKADRSTGELSVSPTQLARALRKSRRSLFTYLGELQSRGLLRLSLAHNQHERTHIQIRQAFWPYQRSLVQEPEAAESQYVDQVARLLLDAPGVQCSFSPADRQLAARLYRQGLSLRQIEQALLLGCARKHVAWLNGHTGGPITSLSYFEPLIQEVQKQPVSDHYWDYLKSRLKTLRQQWKQQSAEANFASATHSAKERRDAAFSTKETHGDGLKPATSEMIINLQRRFAPTRPVCSGFGGRFHRNTHSAGGFVHSCPSSESTN